MVGFVGAVLAALRAKGVWRKLAWGLMAAFVALECTVFIELLNSNKPRAVVARNGCIANLKMMEGAKETWALEFQKAGTDTPIEADLFGPDTYIREKPTCPQSGVYRLGAVNEKPTCSLGGEGHTCP